MTPVERSFLVSVLGDVGVGALEKATERVKELEHVLVPRTIVAWITSAPRYEGLLPGVDSVSVSFEKSESGFTGHVGDYRFDKMPLLHVGASVAVALGVDHRYDVEELRDIDVERMAKSIDLLAKVRRVHNELAKKEPFCPGCTFKTDKHGKNCTKVEKPLDKDELEKGKDGGPGLTAAPMAPTAPTPPTGTAPQQSTTTTLPTLPGSAQKAKPAKAALPAKPIKLAKPTTRLTRSEAGRECGSCGQRQFGEDPFVFRGCACFRALSSGVNVLGISKSEVVLQMDPRMWDPAAMVTFLESVGRIRDDR